MRVLRLCSVFFLTLWLIACAATPTPAPMGTTVTEAQPTAATEATYAPEPTPSSEQPTAPEPTAEPTAEPTEESAPEPAELVVFAAASLTDAFGEIGALFESQNPGSTVVFNFAGSNQLAEQIGQGAPADVFASANKTQMDVAVESTRIMTGTQHTFVRNRLVVITPADNPGGVSTLQDLAKPGLKLVLAAEAVPVGRYSLEFLDKAVADSANFAPDFKDTVLANVVSYEENVRAVLTKVTLGEADVGIVYVSDITAEDAPLVAQVEIPDALNVIASYPIAPLADSPNPELAAAFIELVMSPEGQTILVNYGFTSVIGTESGAAPSAMPLEITGKVDSPLTLTAEDAKAMTLTTISATDRDGVAADYTGVLISELLAEAGVQDGATEIVFTGGDGYSQAVPLADLEDCADCIIAIDENDAFRNILPATMPRYWVKGLISMVVQ